MPKYFIYQGDAFQILDKLAPNSADLVFTSPAPTFFERERGLTDPNIVGTEEDTFEYMRHLFAIIQKTRRVLKPSGSLWLELADYHDYSTGTVMMVPEQIALNMLSNEWYLISPCIWTRAGADKTIEVGDNRRRFFKDWEYIYWFTKSPNPDYYFNEDCGVNKTSLFDAPYFEPKEGDFISGFPEDLINIAIKATCPENGVVLDPLAGSGTTGVAALKNNRYFAGIEINPYRAEMMQKRLEKVTKQLLLNLNPSKTV